MKWVTSLRLCPHDISEEILTAKANLILFDSNQAMERPKSNGDEIYLSVPLVSMVCRNSCSIFDGARRVFIARKPLPRLGE